MDGDFEDEQGFNEEDVEFSGKKLFSSTTCEIRQQP